MDFNNVKKNLKEIVILGVPYGAILIFSAFGPATTRLLGYEEGGVAGSFFMLAISLAMLLTPLGFLRRPVFRPLFVVLTLVDGLLVMAFPFFPLPVQYSIMVLFGLNLGLFARLWAFKILEKSSRTGLPLLIVGVLAFSYGLLYLCNVVFPSIRSVWLTLLPGAMIIAVLPLYLPLPRFDYKSREYGREMLGRFPERIIWIIFLIFITAGYTYVGIYPQLEAYQPHQRFYNVLPFLLTLAFMPMILRRLGHRVLPYLGVAFLGISYCFFLLPEGVDTYYLTQTFLQPGWAFLDCFAWVLGIEIAQAIDRPQYLNKTVGAFLMGTFVGALAVQLLKTRVPVTSPVFFTLSLVPLFLVIPLLSVVYQAARAHSPSPESLLPGDLTLREREVAALIVEGMSLKEIAQELHISQNTMKTHSRNIYRKIGVKNKKELIDMGMTGRKGLF